MGLAFFAKDRVALICNHMSRKSQHPAHRFWQIFFSQHYWKLLQYSRTIQLADWKMQKETLFSNWQRANSGRLAAQFRVHASGSNEAFADLLAEESNIAMSLREISPEEVILGLEAGLGPLSAPGQNRVIALDALIPVVSPRKPSI